MISLQVAMSCCTTKAASDGKIRYCTHNPSFDEAITFLDKYMTAIVRVLLDKLEADPVPPKKLA
jgi:hypothetical protein